MLPFKIFKENFNFNKNKNGDKKEIPFLKPDIEMENSKEGYFQDVYKIKDKNLVLKRSKEVYPNNPEARLKCIAKAQFLYDSYQEFKNFYDQYDGLIDLIPKTHFLIGSDLLNPTTGRYKFGVQIQGNKFETIYSNEFRIK